jgi:ketosteroid isomerase-like protein
MSQADVDTIRRGYTDLNRRDVEAWLDAFHPNAEMYDLAGGPQAPPRRGHQALREWVETVEEIWEDGRYEPEEFMDAGGFVVVAVRVRGRRRDTRVTIDVSMYQVFEMRDGRIQRGAAYLDKDEALEAVGLRAPGE